jgi:hypothetical protein
VFFCSYRVTIDGILDTSITQSEQSCPMVIGHAFPASTPLSVPSDFTSPSSSQRLSPQSTTEVLVVARACEKAVGSTDTMPPLAVSTSSLSCCEQEVSLVQPVTEPGVAVASNGTQQRVVDDAPSPFVETWKHTGVSEGGMDGLQPSVIAEGKCRGEDVLYAVSDIQTTASTVADCAVSSAVRAVDAAVSQTPQIRGDVDAAFALSLVESVLGDVMHRLDDSERRSVVDKDTGVLDSVVQDLVDGILASVVAWSEAETVTMGDALNSAVVVSTESSSGSHSPSITPTVAPSPALIVEPTEILDVSGSVRVSTICCAGVEVSVSVC